MKSAGILFLFSLFFSFSTFAEISKPLEDKDSLFRNWQNHDLPDSIRYDAFIKFIWQDYLFSKSDSVFYFTELLLEQARKDGLTFQEMRGLNIMGVAYDFRGNYAKAVDFYTKSMRLAENQENTIGVAMAANNIGLIYAEQENFDKAILYYKKSLKIKEEFKDAESIAKGYNNLGLAYFGQKKFSQALSNYLKSLKINERINDIDGIAMALNNIGNVYFERKELDLAKEYFERSLAFEKEINNEKGISTSLTSIGLVLYEKGEHSLAMSIVEEAFNLAVKIDGITEKRDAAQALWKIYKKQYRFSDALKMHELFVEIRDTILSEDNQREVIQKEYQYNFDKEQAIKKAEHEAELERREILAAVDRDRQTTIIYGTSGGFFLVLLFSVVVFNRFKVTKRKSQIIQQQKEIMEVKSKEILDSIKYAKRLQNAILPPEKLIKFHLPDSFIIYKPKDIVAGDFYFMDVVEENSKKLIYYAAADCTGHGVPGAMVSIVGANGLKRCIQEFKLRSPGEILDKLAEIVAENFSQSEERIRDGMDLSLCCLEMEGNRALRVHYAGANNPLWIINPGRKEVPPAAMPFIKGGGFEIKANKQGIGYSENINSFDTHSIDLIQGDILYNFSDGFSDQFGGDSLEHRQSGGRKFKSANLKKLLISLHDCDMENQKILINKAFEDWKGELEQLDDVCIIGVRV